MSILKIYLDKQRNGPARPKMPEPIADRKLSLSTQEKKKLNEELLEAAKRGKTEKVRELLGNGAEVDAENWMGWTALCWAARMGHTKTVEVLIASGANVNKRSWFDEMNPLLHAMSCNKPETEKILRDKGAEVVLFYSRMTITRLIRKNKRMD